MFSNAETLTPRLVASALRARMRPDDLWFDLFLPDELRVVSSQYWTHLDAAVRVAEWLEELDVGTVVDIGSGAGKLCVAAALAGNARFVGVEQRPRLVTAARDLARVFEVEDRVEFIEGTFGETPLPRAEAYYLYNPFGESLFRSGRLDADVELSDERFLREVTAVRRFLREAPSGTYVLTYNGFGGQVPSSYQEVRVDRELPNVLRMWRKQKTSLMSSPDPQAPVAP